MESPSGRRNKVPSAGDLAVFDPLDSRHWVICSVALVSIGLLFIGLVADDAIGPLFLGSLSGAAMVALWLHHRERVFAELSSGAGHSQTRIDM